MGNESFLSWNYFIFVENIYFILWELKKKFWEMMGIVGVRPRLSQNLHIFGDGTPIAEAASLKVRNKFSEIISPFCPISLINVFILNNFFFNFILEMTNCESANSIRKDNSLVIIR